MEIRATNKDLLQHAVRVMNDLHNKRIAVEDAKAHANLLKQSNNIMRYELDRAIAMQKFDKLEIRDIEEK
jgi:hypothetical protein